MSFKFLHIADAHIGHGQWHGKTRDARRDDFAASFMQVCKEASGKVDFAIIAGDLFDGRPLIMDRSVARSGIESLGCPVYMIRGNHDLVDRDGLSPIDEIADVVEDAYVLDFPSTALKMTASGRWGEVHLYGIPWSGGATRQRFMATIEAAGYDVGYKILVAHCGIEGLMPLDFPETISGDMLRQAEQVFDYIALGHIHKPYRSYRAVMPGSVDILNKGEVDYSGGAVIVTVADDGALRKRDIIASKRKWDIKSLDVTGLDSGQIIKSLPRFESDAIAVLELVGETDVVINRRQIRGVITSRDDVFVLQIDDNTTVSDTTASVDVVDLTDYFTSVLGGDAAIVDDMMAAALSGDMERAEWLLS